jgi:hypothetical protein
MEGDPLTSKCQASSVFYDDNPAKGDTQTLFGKCNKVMCEER